MRLWSRFAAGMVLGMGVACGQPDPNAPIGTARPAAEVTGVWTAVPADAACTGGPVTFSVSGSDDDVLPFGSLTFSTTWSTASASGPLYGTINLRTGVVALRLFGVDSAAATIDGQLNATAGMDGRFADPYATLAPVFGAAPCASAVSASRTVPSGAIAAPR